MKPHLGLFVGLCAALATSMPAQETLPASTAELAAPSLRSAEQLDELLGPIALYPDALMALILPAATVPSDIVLASRYLSASGDPAQLDAQLWDDSVKALAHYPEVVTWMDTNLAWTKQLGEAFNDQPADVMKSIQRLRARARAAGTLVDTQQQQIVVEGEIIEILPAREDVIYVPRYDPEVVYYMRPGFYSDPYISFGVGFPVGFWLCYNFDWSGRRVWYVNRPDRDRYWREHRDWRHPVFPGRPGFVPNPNWHPWRPLVVAPRPPVRPDVRRARPEIVRPATLPGTPARPPGWQRNDGDRRRGGLPPSSATVNTVGPQPAGPIPQAQPLTAPTTTIRHDQTDGDRNRPVRRDDRVRVAPSVPNAPQVGPQPATPAPAAQPLSSQSSNVRRDQPDRVQRERGSRDGGDGGTRSVSPSPSDNSSRSAPQTRSSPPSAPQVRGTQPSAPPASSTPPPAPAEKERNANPDREQR